MRILLSILLSCQLLSVVQAQSAAEKIVQVGAGEYLTTYRTNEGKLWTVAQDGYSYKAVPYRLKNITDVQGAQYTNIALNDSGQVFVMGLRQNGLPYAVAVDTTADGKSFEAVDKIYGWYQTYLALKNGKIFIWGEDLLKINDDKKIVAPVLLASPTGLLFKKLVPVTMNNPAILALADDGTVWLYKQWQQKPEKIKINGSARDIAGVGAAAFVVETNNDLLAWGYLGTYLGLPNFTIAPQSIKSKWTAAGCVFPAKEMVGNYNTLHIIDANNNLFGAGENVQGEVGNGEQYPDWKNYRPSPYNWSWKHGQQLTAPVQIPGKFQNIYTGTSVTFYHFVQDMGGNWYSWGRNKGLALGNGVRRLLEEEYKYPNGRTVPFPKMVEPLTVKWKLAPAISLSDPSYPMANPGINQYIKTDNSILNGSFSSQQGGKIVGYRWQEIGEDTNAIIESPGSAISRVRALSPGTHIFRLTVTNALKLSDSADVTIEVLKDK